MTRQDTLRVRCPVCTELTWITLSISHDPGCWRTKNGDGWPESWEYDTLTNECGECHTPTETEAFAEAIEWAFDRYLSR